MELVFEVRNPEALQHGEPCSCVFVRSGGVIGRHPDCDWCIADKSRLISGWHARITYRDGHYFMTDISRNGIEHAQGGWLRRNEEFEIHDGAGFHLGPVAVRARLCELPGAPDPLMSDNAADPTADVLCMLNVAIHESGMLGEEAVAPRQGGFPRHVADHAPASHDHLLVPRLIPDVAAGPSPVGGSDPHGSSRLSQAFWAELGDLLSIDLETMTMPGRESLLLNAARLLKACVEGLQGALWSCSDAQAQIAGQGGQRSVVADPLTQEPGPDAFGTLQDLLLQEPGRALSGRTVSQAFRQLHAHQTALLAAGRAMARGALEHFSPRQLNWEFERDSSRPVINTAGSRWRAYLRFHHALSHNDDWTDDLLARHFARAYRDQMRLIDTLCLERQG